MKNLLEFEKYDPKEEYKGESRRNINLDHIRQTKEYEDIIELGFKDVTSEQQEMNNTLKFQRKRQPEERGRSMVFYTIHPSGTIRRYNPINSSEVPQGEGNPIKKYPSPFRSSKEYLKGLRYLFQYLKRKEKREDYR